MDYHDVFTGPFDTKFMARNRVRSWDEVSFTIQAQAKIAHFTSAGTSYEVRFPQSTHLSSRL